MVKYLVFYYSAGDNGVIIISRAPVPHERYNDPAAWGLAPDSIVLCVVNNFAGGQPVITR